MIRFFGLIFLLTLFPSLVFANCENEKKSILEAVDSGDRSSALLYLDKAIQTCSSDNKNVIESEWIKSIDISAMTDDKSVYLSLSGTSFRNAYGQSQTPSLHIRCLEEKTSFYINWGEYLGDDDDDVYSTKKYMRSRLDKDKPIRKLYSVSTDNEALGLWRGNNSIPFIKTMFGKEKMVAQVTPYGESGRETVFNIYGLEQEIKELRDACGW